MDGASRANAQEAVRLLATHRRRAVGNIDSLIAAVDMLELSVFTYGFVHLHTALLLFKLIPHFHSVADDTDRGSQIFLLKTIVQLLFNSKWIDKGTQQRVIATDSQPK
ncbi:hypothetical protein OC846_006479, partial [Tilletia horrida]